MAVRLRALSLSNKLNLFPIYVIRDPRGVVNSLFKKEIRDYGERRNSSLKHIIKWIVKNLLTLNAMKNIKVNNKIYLRYQYFTKNPVKVLKFLESSLNCNFDYVLENDKVTLNLQPGHVFTGNRSRLDSGKITINEDQKWKKELNWTYKILISITTVPLFKRIIFKYKLKNWIV